PPAANSSATPSERKRSSVALALLQRLGRSLMMPIAVLPAAAILLRLGQPDLLGPDGLAGLAGMGWREPVAGAFGTAGDAVSDALPVLVAVGVALGWAKRSDGSTAGAAAVGHLVFEGVAAWTTVAFDAPRGDLGSQLTTYPLE